MEKPSKNILNQALELPANERAALAEQLLMSLGLADSDVDGLWASEAESRVDEYEKGNIETKTAQEVFAKYQK